MSEEARLRSHQVSAMSLDEAVQAAELRIRQQGDRPYASMSRQLELLSALTTFSLGRFLLQHRGLDGFWTDYILMHPERGRLTGQNHEQQPLAPLESFILDEAPSILATQQRFKIFLELIQQLVKDDTVLASVPCGLMGDLLYLDYSEISAIELVVIDLDPNSLVLAADNAEQQSLSHRARFVEQDAWQLEECEAFDLISSNGLTIYEPDDEKVESLFRAFHRALKPGGQLITSFLTPPPIEGSDTEWKMRCVSLDNLLQQQAIFSDVVDAGWQVFRHSEKMRQLLTGAGFNTVEIVYDEAHIFPTAVAWKR